METKFVNLIMSILLMVLSAVGYMIASKLDTLTDSVQILNTRVAQLVQYKQGDEKEKERIWQHLGKHDERLRDIEQGRLNVK